MAPTIQNSINVDSTIHVVHLASGDLWAGAEVMLYTLAKALHTELDVKVTVILLNHGMLEHKLQECGINLHVLDESQLNAFQILQQLNKIIKNIKPDVIHTHRIKENTLGSIAGWINHVPSLRTAHGAPEHRPSLHKLAKRLILFVEWFLGRYCQKNIIAVSSDLGKILERKFPKKQISVIPNGIDIDALKRNILNRSPDDNGNYHIGIAGRLSPVKRIDLFIECAFYLKHHHPELPIQFHIYGDGPLQNTLKDQIQLQRAEAYIHLEGHCNNISQKLQTLDALLMTSDHEGLPMVLLEAMSLQVPIIAHAIGGIPHLLENGQCGILIQNHTAKEFALAIINLLKQPEECQALTRRAFDCVRNNYSSVQTANTYLSLYKNIIRTY